MKTRPTLAEATTPLLSRRRLLTAGAGLAAGTLPLGQTRAWPGPRPPRVRVLVDPNPVPVDAPFAVRVVGLAPRQAVTLRAVTTDGARLHWTAEAAFVADAHGEVDLGAQAPRSGSYAVADPMGLVWSAAPRGGRGARNRLFYAPALEPAPLTITAEVDGGAVARVEVVRTLLTPAVTAVDVAEDGLVGRFFRPAGDAPVPAVLTLGGSEGGLRVGFAALLATHGFAALALAYFAYGPPLPSSLANIPLEYFGRALAWLGARPGVRGDRLAVLGQSRGGELALLLGATYPELSAVVSYVGSGIVFPSPEDWLTPAWTYRGEPVPSFSDPASWNEAAIPVERIAGPVLLISGEADRLWPSALLSQLALDRLRAHDHPHPDRHLRYAEAGHIIEAPYFPTAQDLDRFGGTQAGTAAAAADSWPRVLALLADRLRR
jgi:dienelactone hydrolase